MNQYTVTAVVTIRAEDKATAESMVKSTLRFNQLVQTVDVKKISSGR